MSRGNLFQKLPQEELLQRAMERFHSGYIPEPNTGCWLWKTTSSGRYGMLFFNGQDRLAHKFAYEQMIGPVPNGMELDHLCRVTICCNPWHLEPVSHAENCKRGRDHAKPKPQILFCKARNHSIAKDGWYFSPKGKRMCRACIRIRQEQRKIAQRASVGASSGD